MPVLQRQYRPAMAAGLEGMIADMAESQVGTRVCETAAGIAFGRAVSQGSVSYKGAIIGGSAFIGVTVRDITIVPYSNLDPNNEGALGPAADIYPRYSNMSVLSRGHIWLVPNAIVVPGDPVYYDTTTGKFTNSASGAAAQGSITFTRNPSADQTIVIAGVTWTFKASGAVLASEQSNIGATLGQTLANLADALNATADTTLDNYSYAEDPPRSGGSSGAYRLLIAQKTVGEAGNSDTITAGTTTGATASGATLAGGTAAGTIVNGASWQTGALAGQLARASFGIQD